MKSKFTLALVLLNAVVFAYIMHVQKNSFDVATNPSGILGSDVKNIEYLEVLSDIVGINYQVEYINDSWKLKQPVDWPANAFAIQRIISQIKYLEKDVTFPVKEALKSGRKLADYGLDEPLATLKFGTSGKQVTVKIGKVSKLGNLFYLLDSGEKNIVMIKHKFVDALLINLEQLASRNVFNIPLFEIKSLALSSQKHNLSIFLDNQKGQWSFKAPIQVNANNKSVDIVIGQLANLQIKQFVENENLDISQGLSASIINVELHGNNRKEVLLVEKIVDVEDGPPICHCRIAGNNVNFTIKTNVFNRLIDAQELLRDRRIVNFDTNIVDTIRVEDEHVAQVSLQKLSNDRWKVVRYNKGDNIETFPADFAVVQNLLQSILKFSAKRFINDAPSEKVLEQFKKPLRKVSIKAKDHDLVELLISTLQDDNSNGVLCAKLATKPFIYEIDKSVVHTLTLKPLFYRDKLLFDFADSVQVQSIKLFDKNTGKVFLSMQKGVDQIWENFIKDFPQSKQQAFNDIIEFAKHPSIKSYLSCDFAAPFYTHKADNSKVYVKWDWELEIDVFLPGASHTKIESIKFSFTSVLQDNIQFGGLQKNNLVFVIPQSLMSAIKEFSKINE